MLKCGLIGYAYNAKHFQADSDVPDHEKIVNNGRDPYIEAIVGAVFYDSNYDTTKRWILKWLLRKQKGIYQPCALLADCPQKQKKRSGRVKGKGNR